MAWDGSGNFTRTNGTQTGAGTWADARDAGNNITASQHDTHDEDLADGIGACLAKNGESKPTADFKPNADATYSLGSSVLRWVNLWLSGALKFVSGANTGTVQMTPTAARTLTLPDATDTLVGKATTDTLTGKTHTNPAITDQTLTDAATVDWDMSSGGIASLTLGGNRTMAAPTNLKKGTYILHVIQDGTGSRTVTWNSVFKWSGGTAPTLSTGASKRDILTFVCDGTNLYGSWLLDVR